MDTLTYTVDEAAALLGVGPRWLAEAARHKRVPSVKLGRYVRFTRAQLDEIVTSHSRDGDTPHPWGLTPAAARRTRRTS
jgi:excisionase family DNA binding protein